MKSDYYVVKFWQKSEHFYFLGLKGLIIKSSGLLQRQLFSEEISFSNYKDVIFLLKRHFGVCWEEDCGRQRRFFLQIMTLYTRVQKVLLQTV